MRDSTSDEAAAQDSLYLYMKDINRASLLSAEEERQLARALWDGREAAQRLAQGEAGAPLEAMVEDGQRARERLIRANTFLVVNIARRYMNQGFGLLDLIQEGNLGLIRAVDKFDYRHGTRFSTYATYWIRQNVSRFIGTQRHAVRLPSHQAEALARYRRVENELAQQGRSAATLQEVAEQLGIPTSSLAHLLVVTQPSLSLESPRESDDRPLGDTLLAAEQPAVEELVVGELLRDEVGALLDVLSDRERLILQLRFGLRDGEPRTLAAIARCFGLTKERIRQIEGEALRKLRQLSVTEPLREYLA